MQRAIKGIYREQSGLCHLTELYHVQGVGHVLQTGWTPFQPTGETAEIRGWGDRDTDQAVIYRAKDIPGEFLATPARSEK